jgi:hypothetical protein
MNKVKKYAKGIIAALGMVATVLASPPFVTDHYAQIALAVITTILVIAVPNRKPVALVKKVGVSRDVN